MYRDIYFFLADVENLEVSSALFTFFFFGALSFLSTRVVWFRYCLCCFKFCEWPLFLSFLQMSFFLTCSFFKDFLNIPWIQLSLFCSCSNGLQNCFCFSWFRNSLLACAIEQFLDDFVELLFMMLQMLVGKDFQFYCFY